MFDIFLFFVSYVGMVILLWIIYAYINDSNFDTLYYYGQSMNIVAAITSVIMWIPQIIKSYKLKSPGSLSIIALVIHALGCIITFVYQVFLSHQTFLVGFPYLIGAILEISVIFLAKNIICKNK